MSHLAIEDLKTALVSLGIPLPSTDNKKEYIELYKKHISPLRNVHTKKKSYNQLSSDDEEEEFSSKSVYTSTSKSKTYTKMTEKSFESESEIYSLSDEQLYEKLSSFNVSVGPIVDSTRRIYQRKLIKLMGGDVVDSSFNGDVDNDDYSDSDSELHKSEGKNVPSEKTSKSTYSAGQSPSSTLRSRGTTSSSISSLSNSLSFDHDRHTPSPRPSLRSAASSTTTSTSTKYITPGGTLRETKSVRHTYSYPSQKEQSSEDTSSILRRLFVKSLFILMLLAALYFSYQFFYSESSLRGLEHLAQQALDLAKANENTKTETKVKSKP